MATFLGRRVRRSTVTLAVMVAAFVPDTVEGHHVVSEYGIAPVAPETRTEIDFQLAEFDLDASSGTWFAVAPVVEYAPLRWLSASARFGIVGVRYRTGGEDATGLADTDLCVKLRVAATEHGEIIASVGLGLGLPTGDSRDGIGNGHVELSPFVVLSSQVTPWLVLTGLVADHVSLADEHEHEHASVVAPHGAHEVVLRLGASAFVRQTYVSLGGDAAIVVSGEAGSFVAARGEVGWLPARRLRFALGVDLPVAGERRFEWRARLGVGYLF